MEISHIVFKELKDIGKEKRENILIFEMAAELYEVLEQEGLIKKIKETQLLGNILVKKSDSYSRFDYAMMQLYLFQFIRGKLEIKLPAGLGSKYHYSEFSDKNISKISDYEQKKEPTIIELLQVMVLIYNIGHFRNTFTSSRAMVEILQSNASLYDNFILNFEHDIHKKIARKIIDSNGYHRFHLLNSLLLLLDMDGNSIAVNFAINLLTEYLLPEKNQSARTRKVFTLFKLVREVSFTAMDLAIAPVPVYLDIHNDKNLKMLLNERLSEFNDHRQINNLFKGLNKLLQDTVYNEENSVIIQFDITRRMTNKVLKSPSIIEKLSINYKDFITSTEEDNYNTFNKKYSENRDFDSDNILKLSFEGRFQKDIEKLVKELGKINFVKAAWYYRINEKRVTMLVTIKKTANNFSLTSFKVMRKILKELSNLRKNNKEELFETQILLTTKFFLYYLFDRNNVILEGTIHNEICVLMDQGTKKRIKSIDDLLKNHSDTTNKDSIHEIDFLKKILESETTNELTVTVCSSILVKNKTQVKEDLAEFDGLIIFPNRDKNQVIFAESKNTKKKLNFSVKCLKGKFDKVEIDYNDDFQTINKDCKYIYSIT